MLKHEEYGRVILELKSINDKGFKALIDTPKPEHLVQLQIYLNLMFRPFHPQFHPILFV